MARENTPNLTECLLGAGDLCRDQGEVAVALGFYARVRAYERMLCLDLAPAVFEEIEGRPFHLHSVNTGVPHVVAVMDHIEMVEVWKLGRAIRQHPAFAPAGTNVNFISSEAHGSLSLRTYERGVEDETYACGTGAVASAIVARELGMTGEETEIITTGGEVLGVILRDGKTYLRGAAELVFHGVFYPQSMGIEL